MLSKLIVSSYATLLEISIWLILILSFIAGFSAHGVMGAVFALCIAFIFCTTVFGLFLTIVDIRQSVKIIESRQAP